MNQINSAKHHKTSGILSSQTYFLFQEQFYKHVEGAPMASSVSPIVANLYMEHFEEVALRKAENLPRLWKRYVDDILSYSEMNTKRTS